MVDDIKASFKELVSESEWMGKDIQARFFEMIKAIRSKFYRKLIQLIQDQWHLENDFYCK